MGNYLEKKKIDAPAELQPKTSPYLTTPITFLIGPQEACYTVQRAFLAESPQWSSQLNGDSEFRKYRQRLSHIALPEVNEDAGHTLVHYLYTGTFQKLQSPEDDDLTADLKKNLNLYGVAVKYGLAGLKELSLEDIQSKEGSGDIFDILEIIKKAFNTLLEHDLGLKPYIERELKAAFESDGTFFGKERFIELFGEAKQFDRILMRIVADIYSEKIAQVSQNRPAVINSPPPEAIFTTKTSSPCSPLFEEPAAKKGEEPIDYGELYEYEKPSEYKDPFTLEDLVDKLDISEEYLVQTRFSTLKKKPYKDLAVNSVNSSKKYTCTDLKPVPAPEEEKWGESAKPHSESNPWDHPLPLSQNLPSGSLPVNTRGLPEHDVNKKFEELKGWKFSAPSPLCEDPVPHNETASHVEVERIFGGKSTSCEVVDFVYKRINVGEAVPSTEAVTLEKPALCQEYTPAEAVFIEEADPFELKLPIGKTKEKMEGKKAKRDYDFEREATSVVEEPVPYTEVAPIEEAASIELDLPIWKAEKGKKGVMKKMCIPIYDSEREAIPVVKEPVPYTEVSSEVEAAPAKLDLSIGKAKKGKKGKKGKKTKSAMPDPVSRPPSVSSEIVPQIPASITAEEAARTENGDVDLHQQQHPDDESSRICASRATHLFIDEEWKKCQKCRALIRHLSLQLARNMNEEDQNEYEII